MFRAPRTEILVAKLFEISEDFYIRTYHFSFSQTLWLQIALLFIAYVLILAQTSDNEPQL